MPVSDSAGIAARDAGSTLPLVLVGLTALALLALAGFDSARFALQAARSQVWSTAALHAAESAVELYLAGAGPVDGPLEVEATPGRAALSVRTLVRLPDSTRIVALTAEGRAPSWSTRSAVRRVGVVAHLDPTGGRSRVSGSLAEIF